MGNKLPYLLARLVQPASARRYLARTRSGDKTAILSGRRQTLSTAARKQNKLGHRNKAAQRRRGATRMSEHGCIERYGRRDGEQQSTSANGGMGRTIALSGALAGGSSITRCGVAQQYYRVIAHSAETARAIGASIAHLNAGGVATSMALIDIIGRRRRGMWRRRR